MPAPPARVGPRDLVRLAQLYARHAEVTNARGERYETTVWSETDVVQWMLRQPRAQAPLSRAEGGARGAGSRPDGGRDGRGRRWGGRARPARARTCDVTTVAGVTTTLGGLVIDVRARAAGECSPAAPTQAVWLPAATRAGWQRHSCSAGSRPARRSGRARERRRRADAGAPLRQRAALLLGIEEELLLVDEDGLGLAHVADQVLPGIELPRERADHEAFLSEIECAPSPARPPARPWRIWPRGGRPAGGRERR